MIRNVEFPRTLVLSALVLLLACTVASPQTAEDDRQQESQHWVTILERSVPVSSPPDLRIRVRGIDVMVRGVDLALRSGERPSVELMVGAQASTRTTAEEAAQSLECSVSGKDPEVVVECTAPPRSTAGTEAPDGASPPIVELVATTPEGSRVDISTERGRIEIPRLSGAIDLETGGGDVVLGRIAGAVSIRSGDGNVWLERVDEGPVEIESTGGGIGVQTSTAPLDLHTETGEIMVGLGASVRAQLTSDSGDVTVVIARDVGVEFDAGGRFVVLGQSLPLKAFLTKRHGEGQIGGGGPGLTVDSPNGCVRIGTAHDFGPEGGISDVCRKLAEQEEAQREDDGEGGI